MVLSLGAPFRLVIVRDGVEERLFMYLKGGRLMLIKSTLSSLPISLVFVCCFEGVKFKLEYGEIYGGTSFIVDLSL